MPPAAATMRLSVASCRNSRTRPAPSAVRSPSSRTRRSESASARLATLAQARRRISSVDAPSARSSGRLSAVSSSWSDAVRPVRPREPVASWSPACALLNDSATVLTSAVARFDRRAAGEASEHPQRGERAMALPWVRLGARPERAGGRGHVDVARDRVLRKRRQHADHRVRPVVHPQHAADHAGVAAELRLPVLVAQDEDGLRADVVIARAEGAAQERPHAEHVEEVGRYHCGLDPVRFVLVQQHERHRVVLDQVADRRQARAIVIQLLDRDAGVGHVRCGRRLLDEHQLVALREGQRREQDAANHGEHRGVRADAEREHADRRGRVAGRAAKRPTAEADVLPERVPEGDA